MATSSRILFIVVVVCYLAARSSAAETFPRLKRFKDSMLNDLIKYVLAPADDSHKLKEEKEKDSNDFLPKLISLSSNFNKHYFDNATGNAEKNENNFNIISSIPDNLIDKAYRNIKKSHSTLQNVRDDSSKLYSLDDKEKVGQTIRKDASELNPAPHKNLRSPNLSYYLSPYFDNLSENDARRTIKFLQALETGMFETSNHACENKQISSKVLKSPIEIDGRTGTKFYDSRPNVTDLLNDIRNITKDRLAPTLNNLSTKSPSYNIDFDKHRNELVYNPDIFFKSKKVNNQNQSLYLKPDMKLSNRQKFNNAISRLQNKAEIKNENFDIDLDNLQRLDSLVEKNIQHRSIRTQNKQNFIDRVKNNANSLEEPEKPLLRTTDPSSYNLGHSFDCKDAQDENTVLVELKENATSREVPSLKNASQKVTATTSVIDNIISDMIKEIDKKLRNNQHHTSDQNTNLNDIKDKLLDIRNEELQQEKQEKISQKGEDKLESCHLNNAAAEYAFKALKKENTLLNALKLPIVTSDLTIKEAGIPLYNIPNSNIYLYESDSRKKSNEQQEESELESQLNPVSILDQILNNNTLLSSNDFDQSNLDIINKNLISYENTFNKNSLPTVLTDQNQVNPKSDTLLNFLSKNVKIPLIHGQDQSVPEIEIHIKNMPLSQETNQLRDLKIKEEQHLFSKKPNLSNRHDVSSNQNNELNQTYKYLVPEIKYQDMKLLGGSETAQMKKSFNTKQIKPRSLVFRQI